MHIVGTVLIGVASGMEAVRSVGRGRSVYVMIKVVIALQRGTSAYLARNWE